MTHQANGSGRAVAWLLLALSAGAIGSTVLADAANDTKTTTSTTRRQVKTMQDSMGTSLTSTGGLGSKGKPSDRSFSSAAYREKASAELRRMREQMNKEPSATNSPSTNATDTARLTRDMKGRD
jgi:hypothetical protein